MNNYLDFWEIDRPVFRGGPNDNDAFFPKSRYAVMERIVYFCQQGTSVISLSAPAGFGKTTLAYWLYKNIPTDTHEALIFNLIETVPEAGWLTNQIATFFHIDVPESRSQIAKLFAILAEERRKLVVIVDNAHYIDGKACEDLEELLGLGSYAENLISFVFLCDMTNNTPLSNLINTAASKFVTSLPALTAQDCEEFISEQLSRRGVATSTFEQVGAELICNLGQGNIRLIAEIAENCLMEAFIERQHSVSKEMVFLAASHVLQVDAQALNLRYGNSHATDDSGSADVGSNDHQPPSGEFEVENPKHDAPKQPRLISLLDLLPDDDVN